MFRCDFDVFFVYDPFNSNLELYFKFLARKIDIFLTRTFRFLSTGKTKALSDEDVAITNCKKGRCRLKKNTKVSIVMKITPGLYTYLRIFLEKKLKHLFEVDLQTDEVMYRAPKLMGYLSGF